MKNIFASLQHHEFTNVSWEIVPQKKFKKYQDIIFPQQETRENMFSFVQHWKLRVCYGEGTIAEENIMQEHMIPFFLPPPMVVLLLTRWNSTPSSVGNLSQGGAPLWKMVLINWSDLVFVNTTVTHLVLQKKRKEMQERQYSANTCDKIKLWKLEIYQNAQTCLNSEWWRA